MTRPSDSEVVRVLAERDGWHERETEEMALHFPGGWLPAKVKRWFHGDGIAALPFENPPDYLHSLDAIRPLLAKLTPEEWAALIKRVDIGEGVTWEQRANYAGRIIQHCLTLDPPVLARAVAEAILACAGPEKLT